MARKLLLRSQFKDIKLFPSRPDWQIEAELGISFFGPGTVLSIKVSKFHAQEVIYFLYVIIYKEGERLDL